MAMDLRCSGWFHSQSIRLADHELIVLEHEFTHDRVRRFRYDRIGGVIFWRVVPWDRIVVFSILLGGPALLLLIPAVTETRIISIVLLGLLLLLVMRELIYRRTYIQFIRNDNPYRYATISSANRIRQFRETLLDHIERAMRSG